MTELMTQDLGAVPCVGLHLTDRARLRMMSGTGMISARPAVRQCRGRPTGSARDVAEFL